MLSRPTFLLNQTSKAFLAPTSSLVRSLYRRLYKELRLLDSQPLVKTLFPCPAELQREFGLKALYVPNSVQYAKVLQNVFRNNKKKPNIKLGFDILNRIRVHRENLRDRLPVIEQYCKEGRKLIQRSVESSEKSDSKYKFTAEPVLLTPSPSADRCLFPLVLPRGKNGGPLVLENLSVNPIMEGTVLLAHPLSSAHVDRRVMIVTERTRTATTAVVMDLRFAFPLSHGNPMFPEVFWGHDVYDGGFSQIGFTMPPTAQITILHTLEPWLPPVSSSSSENLHSTQFGASQEKESLFITASKKSRVSCSSDEKKKHNILCHPIIRQSGKGKKGEEVAGKEPTLYVSKVEALPYLATLAYGAPRETVRIFWGNMRWPSSQLDAEVLNGHWIPLRVSPSFFFSGKISNSFSSTAERRGRGGDTRSACSFFPTLAEVEETQRLREKHYGVSAALPQTFPPNQTLRKRDSLWDEILYQLGGEYQALIACNNPSSGEGTPWAVRQHISDDFFTYSLTDSDEDEESLEGDVTDSETTMKERKRIARNLLASDSSDDNTENKKEKDDPQSSSEKPSSKGTPSSPEKSDE